MRAEPSFCPGDVVQIHFDPIESCSGHFMVVKEVVDNTLIGYVPTFSPEAILCTLPSEQVTWIGRTEFWPL
jgi:hypothetical protein